MSVKAVRVRGMLMDGLQLQPSWKDGLHQPWPLGSLSQPRQVCGVQRKLQLPGDLCQHNLGWLNNFSKPELTMFIFVRADKTVSSLLHFNPPLLSWRGKWIHSQTHLTPLCFATFMPSARIEERKTWPPWDAPLEFRALEAAVILLRKSQSLKPWQLPGYVGFAKCFCSFIPSQKERHQYFPSAAFGYVSLSGLAF